MKREVLGSVFIGLISLAAVNLFGLISHMDVIMIAVSIYATMMAIGQFLYKEKETINSEEFIYLDEKTKKSFKKRFSYSIHFISLSFTTAILATLFIHTFLSKHIDNISNSVTLVALATLFLHIAYYEE